jgi:hypothetical protein
MRTPHALFDLEPGWHPCPVDDRYERYVDHTGWTSSTRLVSGEQPCERTRVAIGWYTDPADPSRLRYYNGLEWTARVMPKPGSVAPWARRASGTLSRLRQVRVVGDG